MYNSESYILFKIAVKLMKLSTYVMWTDSLNVHYVFVYCTGRILCMLFKQLGMLLIDKTCVD